MRRLAVAAVGALIIWALGGAVARADGTVSPTGFGMWREPALSASAVCRSTGPQAVWIGEAGTAYLDIVQVGIISGRLFYAYGRGEPSAPGSLYVERRLGPAGAGPHRLGLSLAGRVWTLSIDGRAVARVPDGFRTWRLRHTQVMAEGSSFGSLSCTSPGRWFFGGYGPQPRWSFGKEGFWR